MFLDLKLLEIETNVDLRSFESHSSILESGK